MATFITLMVFFVLVGLPCWFFVRQARKQFRLRNLQLEDLEAREQERRRNRAA
ncbi:hypothetical protein [Mycobacterium colombiense]|uniref:hypothetical protein n=1 Tax=Mycobacterium colombiense TaxID=339268 RepID=UPI0015BDCECC|nr:hypothetical protein [Mycobacterium colombiense]